jgi:DNA-binding NarL/FixJ family response regulator
MNGFEAAIKILAIAPLVKIVFFSAHEVPATARQVGADAFVSKSSRWEELELAVSRLLHLEKKLQPQQKSLAATCSSNR